MKKILVLIGALFFAGCVNSQPKVQIASAYKFEKVEFHHIQEHTPSNFIYQSPSIVETKYNEKLKSALQAQNLLDPNSQYELKINIAHRRVFIGEATPLKTDRIGGIFASYQIQIIKNGQILRNFTKDEMMYNPRFFGNLKTIAGQNTDDTLENNAIEALIKDIVETIKRFQS